MNRDCWRTPPEIFEALNFEFAFKVDVCASPQNAMLPHFITEQENCLTADWYRHSGQINRTGWYAWMNPPYSNIGPFVQRAAEMSRAGIGCVMLVMADTSVGWYKTALYTAQEVRFIIGGRLSFINPETEKPGSGNNKGSMLLIWHPFGRGALQVSHVDRDELMQSGRELMKIQGVAA